MSSFAFLCNVRFYKLHAPFWISTIYLIKVYIFEDASQTKHKISYKEFCSTMINRELKNKYKNCDVVHRKVYQINKYQQNLVIKLLYASL